MPQCGKVGHSWQICTGHHPYGPAAVGKRPPGTGQATAACTVYMKCKARSVIRLGTAAVIMMMHADGTELDFYYCYALFLHDT